MSIWRGSVTSELVEHGWLDHWEFKKIFVSCLTNPVQTVTWHSRGRCPSQVETSLGRFQSKMHACKTKDAVVKRTVLFAIVPGDFDLLISTIHLLFCKYRCVTWWVDTFIHARYTIRILDCHCIQLPMIAREVKSFLLLRYKYSQWIPMRLGCLKAFKSGTPSNSCFPNAYAVDHAWYEHECIGQLLVFSSSTGCCTTLLEPRWPSQCFQTM